MGRAVTQSTDERLSALAGALEPIPAQVAVLEATVTHLAVALEPMPSELAVVGSRGGAARSRCSTRRLDGLTQVGVSAWWPSPSSSPRRKRVPRGSRLRSACSSSRTRSVLGRLLRQRLGLGLGLRVGHRRPRLLEEEHPALA